MQKTSFVLSVDYNFAVVVIFAIFAITGVIAMTVSHLPSQPAENAMTRQAGPVSGNSVVRVEVSTMWPVRSASGGNHRKLLARVTPALEPVSRRIPSSTRRPGVGVYVETVKLEHLRVADILVPRTHMLIVRRPAEPAVVLPSSDPEGELEQILLETRSGDCSNKCSTPFEPEGFFLEPVVRCTNHCVSTGGLPWWERAARTSQGSSGRMVNGQ